MRILPIRQMSATDIASAGRRIYWLNRDQRTFDRSLRRVSTTGEHPRTLVRRIGAAAGPMAASRRHVYWQAAGGDTINRVAVDGHPVQRHWLTGVRRQSSGSIVDGLAMHGRFLYLSQCFRGRIGRVPLSAPRRMRQVEWVVRGIDTCPTQLAFTDGFVYWAGSTLNGAGVIGRAPSAGGAPEDTWTRVRSSTGPLSVEVIDNFVYWDWGGTPDDAPSFLGRVRIDGSKFTRKFRRIGSWPITTVVR